MQTPDVESFAKPSSFATLSALVLNLGDNVHHAKFPVMDVPFTAGLSYVDMQSGRH